VGISRSALRQNHCKKTRHARRKKSEAPVKETDREAEFEWVEFDYSGEGGFSDD
jgi:hypothetical protein